MRSPRSFQKMRPPHGARFVLIARGARVERIWRNWSAARAILNVMLSSTSSWHACWRTTTARPGAPHACCTVSCGKIRLTLRLCSRWAIAAGQRVSLRMPWSFTASLLALRTRMKSARRPTSAPAAGSTGLRKGSLSSAVAWPCWGIWLRPLTRLWRIRSRNCCAAGRRCR